MMDWIPTSVSYEDPLQLIICKLFWSENLDYIILVLVETDMNDQLSKFNA